MSYWLDIKDKLKNPIEIAIQLLLMVLVAYVFIMAEEQRIWKIPVIFVGLLIWFFFHKKTKHPMLWIMFFVLLVFDLCYSYFWVANHHFMLLFMVLSVILFSYHKRSDVLLKNIQLLLAVVVMASVVQKLTSSQFMSGNFYYYMINRGTLFGIFLNFFPDSLEVAKSNSESFLVLQATDPNLAQSIVLKDIIPNLGLISLIFAWATVVVEFMVAISILWKPRSKWTHLLFATMIIGILFTRLETGFMALLAICGFLLCSNLKLRLLYVIIVMGSITLIVTKLGYH